MNNPTSTSLNPYHAYQYIGQLQAGVSEKDNLIDLMSERLLKVGSGGGGIIVILLLCCFCCFILIPVIFIFLVREEIIEMPNFIPDSVIKILCDNSLIEIDSVCNDLGSEEEVTTESECSDHGNDRTACESNDCYYNTVQTVCQDDFSCSALGETACNTDERCLWSSEINVCGNKLSCDSLNIDDCINTRDDCMWGQKSQAEPSVAACKVKTPCDTYSSERLCNETYHCVWRDANGNAVCLDRQDCSVYTAAEGEVYCSGASKKANTCVYLENTDTCIEASCDSELLDNAEKCIGSSTAEQACQWVIAGNEGACQLANEGGD